jgi:hypothetical protein
MTFRRNLETEATTSGGRFIGDRDMHNFYIITGGTITVPEPSSLVPLVGGLGWLVFGLMRRRRTRIGEAGFAN